jgi:hypothetical protein
MSGSKKPPDHTLPSASEKRQGNKFFSTFVATTADLRASAEFIASTHRQVSAREEDLKLI